MDISKVFPVTDFAVEYWVFQPTEDVNTNIIFDTKIEAEAAQAGYRLAKGYNTITGETK